MRLSKILAIAAAMFGGIGTFEPVLAQTEQDALMMSKNKICVAAMFGYNSWSDYWEGTFKRDNENIGRLSTKSFMLMLNYGVTKNLNILASLPYVTTDANRGTLASLNGMQDVGLYIKYKPLKKQFGKQNISLFAVGGYSTPTNKYNVEFLPMSIGLGSQVLSARLIGDIQRGKIFTTASAAYMHRSNVKLDRSAYYTDRQVNSNEVRMPDAGSFQLSAGYRSKLLIGSGFIDNTTTFGGFDIRKNDMPFVSNQMNSTRTGLEAKYYLPKHEAFGIHANVWHVLSGRNVGQATGFMAGLVYAFNVQAKSNKQ
ncbi:MAG TPA: hypothetical protein VF602_13010 [Pedobacter sp.]|jgi:hypothetical protein